MPHKKVSRPMTSRGFFAVSFVNKWLPSTLGRYCLCVCLFISLSLSLSPSLSPTLPSSFLPPPPLLFFQSIAFFFSLIAVSTATRLKRIGVPSFYGQGSAVAVVFAWVIKRVQGCARKQLLVRVAACVAHFDFYAEVGSEPPHRGDPPHPCPFFLSAAAALVADRAA